MIERVAVRFSAWAERWLPDAFVFALPTRPDEVRIASRAAVPQELGVARDPRSLRVALRRVVVQQGT